MMESNGKKSRNKTILQIEERLSYLAENDPTNEEMYHLLKKLAYIYVNQNKFGYGYNGVEDVCHDVASDTWLNVLSGKKIGAWIYYIGKMIKLSYVPKQKKLEHEFIDISEDPHLKEAIKNMSAASAISNMKDFDRMQRSLMIDQIGSIIKKTMEQIKYKEHTLEWLQIYINLCINLVRIIYNEKPLYIRIPDHLIPYVDMAIEQFKKNFRNSGFTESIMDNVDEDLEMQLIATDDYKKGVYDI